MTFTQPDTHPGYHPATADLIDVITRTAKHAPRSLQVQLGPSEIGMACKRRLAYRILDWTRTNTTIDPWPATVGTAVHTWLADAFTADNTRLGYTRWAVEAALTIRPGIEGHCDLYDLDTRTVIDSKVLGETSLRALKKDGPSTQYRTQVHLYGLGWDNLGLPPVEVAIAAYPRGGWLHGLHVWSEPYNRDLALAALAAYDDLLITLDVLDVEHHPDLFDVITPTPGYLCRYCDWWNSHAHNPAEGCRGNLA